MFYVDMICGDIQKEVEVEQQEEFTDKTTCYCCNTEDHNLSK
jgi:hypothetical protein